MTDWFLPAIASVLVDHFPRNIFLSIGVGGCMITLIIFAALVANFAESNNEAALQAAVSMLFIFEIPYDWCLDGKSIPDLCCWLSLR